MTLRLAPFPNVLIGFVLLATTALAAVDSPTQYERDRAACLSGPANPERSSCLREASAARADAARGTSTTDEARLQANRLKRCAALPDADRRDCEARMQGAGTTNGSAATGGIYRELVTTQTQMQTPAASAPAK